MYVDININFYMKGLTSIYVLHASMVLNGARDMYIVIIKMFKNVILTLSTYFTLSSHVYEERYLVKKKRLNVNFQSES